MWGLGATLYAAVEGVPPYPADNPVAILTAVIEDRRRPTERAGSLAPLLAEMLAPQESSRPPLARVRERLRPLARRTGDIPAWSAALATAAVSSPAPATPGFRPAGRFPAVLVGSLVAVAGALAGVLLTVGGPNRSAGDRIGTATRPPGAASTGAPGATGSTASAPPATGTPSPAASSPTATPSGPAVSAGWIAYRGQRGWSVAHPPDWRSRPAGGAAGVDLVEPGTGSYLHIDTLDRANPSALADWQRAESGFRQRYPTYRRLRLEPSDGGDGSRQADWEFTYSPGGATLHVLNRGMIRNGHGYALYRQTRASRWDGSQPLMRQLFASFQPAS